MESITLFVSIVIIVFGILQIVLFFKIWGMANNVLCVKKVAEKHKFEKDTLIREAQLCAMDGNYERAISYYQKAFHLGVIELYENIVLIYGDKKDNNLRDNIYMKKYKSVSSYYEKRINKINGQLDKEKYASFDKVNTIISKL